MQDVDNKPCVWRELGIWDSVLSAQFFCKTKIAFKSSLCSPIAQGDQFGAL